MSDHFYARDAREPVAGKENHNQSEVMSTQFFLSLDPPTATAQMKGERIAYKGGKPFVIHYKKKPQLEAEKLFKMLLNPNRPRRPLTGAVRVSCDWFFSFRKSEKKGVTSHFSAVPKTTKPDAGNSNKMLIDCMTDLGFWNDDSQIFDETARKFWSDEPGILIKIEWGVELGYVRKGGLF